MLILERPNIPEPLRPSEIKLSIQRPPACRPLHKTRIRSLADRWMESPENVSAATKTESEVIESYDHDYC